MFVICNAGDTPLAKVVEEQRVYLSDFEGSQMAVEMLLISHLTVDVMALICQKKGKQC